MLNIEGLCKAYPGVIANSDVSLNVAPGEIHALLGENGAGKSTLVKMIYGLVTPDSGTMTFQNVSYAPREPRAARAAGIGVVFQHFSLFDALNVAENVALGMENPPSMSHLAARIQEVSAAYGLPLDPARRVGDLSAGERQRVEVIRCLLQDPKLLIMDEPTSVLTPQEVDILFVTLRKLAADGTSILYISHKLAEIKELCTRATVLRRGKMVGTCDPRETSIRQMAALMVGQSLSVPQRRDKAPGEVALRVAGLNLPSPFEFGTSLHDINVDVARGEVLGVAGVAGNGQDELMLALSGEVLTQRGAITLLGQEVSGFGPNERRARGFVSVPEQRLGHAAAPDMSLSENALLSGAVRKNLTHNGFIDWPATRAFAAQIVHDYDVRTPGIATPARALSGGNLQKFVVGRELSQNPDVIAINQPTWGVDAAAAAAIRQAILDLAAQGAAVLVISQDLDELLEISDNLCVLNGGQLSVPRPAFGLDIAQIGVMMGNAAPQQGETP